MASHGWLPFPRTCAGLLAAPITLLTLLTLLAIQGCDDGATKPPASSARPAPTASAAPRSSTSKLFRRLDHETTGLGFINELPETAELNILVFQYYYNGAGVAVGDVNGDRLPDVYLVANLGPNRLFLNQGGMKFVDATDKAGVAGARKGWATGATMVDVDADGDLDIYVSKSGPLDAELRHNELFINDGKGRFEEKAKRFGLDDSGYSTQAAFFDYDRDGDLDAFVLNHNVEPLGADDGELKALVADRHPAVGDRLYRNDDGEFVDVSEAAGIRGNALGYGLSVSVGDLDDDGFADLYIANDYMERDYLYFNQGDGTFRDELLEAMPHISQFSMGSDIADIDGDGRLDVFVADMAPADNYRQKTMMPSMNIPRFWSYVNNGFHYQYMFNTFQLNRGGRRFSDVAQLAGVARTDWSWSALVADFDRDGHQDLFVTNGRRKNASNVDYKKKKDAAIAAGKVKDPRALRKLLKDIPVAKIPNVAFRNRGDLTFEDSGSSWGLDDPSWSTGAAYADLDRDGDLDLVVSNIDEPAAIYENRSRGHHFLKVALAGPQKNRFGIGARVIVTTSEGKQTREVQPTRGYQSSVEPVLTFGLGGASKVEDLTVRWPDGKVQSLAPKGVDLELTVKHADAKPAPERAEDPARLSEVPDAIDVTHVENDFDDFERELLIPHRMSRLGPALASADVDGDGIGDLYVGGARGRAGRLFLNADDHFVAAASQPFADDVASEDVAARFFDADGDGDVDLYVASGGNEVDAGDASLADRLYVNDGGTFSRAPDALVDAANSSGCVEPGDYDGDGDQDLFICGRQVPGKYSRPARSQLLRNDGGRFVDVTAEVAPDLVEPGMVTAAAWTDLDTDGHVDLVVVGEWLPILVLMGDGTKLSKHVVDDSDGWWWSVAPFDADRDGDVDLIVGNVGLNYKHRASPAEPLSIYSHDFDDDGRLDLVLSNYAAGVAVPSRGRQCSSDQMPFIAAKFPTYDAFGKATLADVYGDQLAEAHRRIAKTLATSWVENRGAGKWKLHPLPSLAQVSAVTSIAVADLDGDGTVEAVLAGNLHGTEVETTRLDGGSGILLRAAEGGPEIDDRRGLGLSGDIKALSTVVRGEGESPWLVAADNGGPLRLFKASAK